MKIINFLNNKKGISEVTSFVLITFLIVITSTFAYMFAKSTIDDTIYLNDLNNMVLNFKKMNMVILEISGFDESSASYTIHFKSGQLFFNDNQIIYNSQNEYLGDIICIENLCSQGYNGYEVLSLNLSNSYTFSKNFNLSAGSYNLQFKNMKNVSKIDVIFN